MGSSTGPASQPDKIGDSLANRADLSLLKTWFAPQRPSVRTSSSRPSGYARPFRFAKEFGPDQVLRSDSESSRQIKRAFGSGESSFDLSLPNASSAIDLLLSSDCVTNRVQNIDEIARGLNFAEKRHSRQHLHLVVRDVVDASKLFVRSELFPGRTLCPLRFSSE